MANVPSGGKQSVDWDLAPRTRELRPPPDSGQYELWGWGARLRSLLDDERYRPHRMDWAVFRPCPESRKAMMQLSVKYPLVIKPVGEALDAANACFEALLEDGGARYSRAATDFSEAERILLERIETSVEIINKAELPAAIAKAVSAEADRVIRANDARDKWLYGLVFKGTPWQTIINRLKKKKTWKQIDTIPGLRNAIDRHREAHGLPKIPARRAGRIAR